MLHQAHDHRAYYFRIPSPYHLPSSNASGTAPTHTCTIHLPAYTKMYVSALGIPIPPEMLVQDPGIYKRREEGVGERARAGWGFGEGKVITLHDKSQMGCAASVQSPPAVVALCAKSLAVTTEQDTHNNSLACTNVGH